MKNKYKKLDLDINIENSVVDIEECNTHFNNHMSGNYKNIIRKTIIIIELVILATILLV